MKFLWLALLMSVACLSYGQSPNLKLVSFQKSSCDTNADLFRIQQRIISQRIDSGVYKLSIGLITNCAGIHNIKLKLKSDTLKLSYEEGGLFPDTALNGKITLQVIEYTCDCAFDYAFKIKGISKLPGVVTVNDSSIRYYADKYKVYPIKFIIQNGDTINRVDRYGLKQGYWHEQKANKGYFTGYYTNDKLKSAETKEYYVSGKLQYEMDQSDYDTYKLRKYYENGVPQLDILQNGKLSVISTKFYPTGVIERVYIDNPVFNEEKLFYSDGHIKKVTGRNIHQDYYPNGVLKKEFWFPAGDIAYKYYYEDGKLMATHYVDKKEFHKKEIILKRNSKGKIIKTYETSYWTEEVGNVWKYYDRKGRQTTAKELKAFGYVLSD